MSVEPDARRAVKVPTVEQILFRIGNEAYVLTAHVKRRRRGAAYLAKAMELIATDVTVWPLTSRYSPSQLALLMERRREARAIIWEHGPAMLERLADAKFITRHAGARQAR